MYDISSESVLLVVGEVHERIVQHAHFAVAWIRLSLQRESRVRVLGAYLNASVCPG